MVVVEINNEFGESIFFLKDYDKDFILIKDVSNQEIIINREYVIFICLAGKEDIKKFNKLRKQKDKKNKGDETKDYLG